MPNYIKILDNILYKKAIFSNITKKTLLNLSRTLPHLENYAKYKRSFISVHDLNDIYNYYIKGKENEFGIPFAPCDLCGKSFPVKSFMNIGNKSLCPLCVLGADLINCSRCHNFIYDTGYCPFLSITIKRTFGHKYEDELNAYYKKHSSDDLRTDTLANFTYNKLCSLYPDLKKCMNLEEYDYSSSICINLHDHDGNIYPEIIDNAKVIEELTDSIVPAETILELAEYNDINDALCYNCLHELYPKLNNNIARRMITDTAIISFNFHKQGETANNINIKDEALAKIRYLINLILNEDVADLYANGINRFNYIGFPSPMEALENYIIKGNPIEKELLRTAEKEIHKYLSKKTGNFYLEGRNPLSEVTKYKNLYTYEILMIFSMDDNIELNNEDYENIENIVKKIFNRDILCPWNGKKVWRYFSVKNRDPEEDDILINSGKIPYCSCNVKGEVANFNIVFEDNLVITFEYCIHVLNKQVHKPTKTHL